MSIDLKGKTAVITGGNSGIGLATALAITAAGGRVLVTGRDAGTIEEAGRRLGDAGLALQSDTADLAAIDTLRDRAADAFGGIDLLFVNAGVALFRPLEQVDEAFYDHLFTVNTRGAFFTVQKLAPLLRPGGSIVVNTSVTDELGMPGATVYGATKAALRSLARTLAAELVGRGIRVNAVSPGPIVTPIYDRLGLDADAKKGLEAQMTGANPMRRFGQAEEVAAAVLFLGFQATYTTGAELVVDGGLTQL